MIILEDKSRISSKEEIDSLVKILLDIFSGIEKSKRIYHKDIFVIEQTMFRIKKNLLPWKRAHEKGFPVNTFRYVLEDLAKAINDLNTHEVYRYKEDAEFIATWLEKNPAKTEMIICQ
jgi:hypothetical protein